MAEDHVEAIAVTRNALEQIERADIDIQVATAKANPRSMDLFYKRAEAMVTLDPITAASCVYRRPVGKANGMMKYAEGESVRLAEIVAASYGNLRVGGRIIEMKERFVKAQGIAHDLETNTAYTAEVVESTVGKTGMPFSERMRVVTAKAAQSKAIRDAIFRVIPKSLCKSLGEKAKSVAAGDAKTFEERRKNVVEWVKTLKIKAERVWSAIGIAGPADITMNVLVLLAGLKTAIEEDDCTVDEAFPRLDQAGADDDKGVADRIMDRFDKPEAKDEQDAPKQKKTKKRKKKTVKKAKAPEQEGEDQTQEPDPPAAPDAYQCQRCKRDLTADEIKDGKCPHCMGKPEKAS